MNRDLKDAIETAYKLCDALEKTDYWDKANTASAREIFRGELFKFLIYLSFSDGKITYGESKFIKDYLGYDYSVTDMRDYAVSNRVYGPYFSNKIPYCYKRFVKADNGSGKVTETSKTILELYRNLGKSFLQCDGEDAGESYSLNIFCQNMSDYADEKFIESVDLNMSRLRKENVIPQPVSDAEDEKPVAGDTQPQEKPRENTEKSLDELLGELNELVGLEQVKKDVNSLINLVKIRKIREERGMESPDMSLHMVFTGNPGTGKTTIARILAGIYRAMGLLSKGHLTEVDRSGLVGGYVGQTAIKTKQVADKAKGGVLFIDEAYSLTVNRGENDYGFEAVDTLLKYMEDNRDDLIVIVAGYPELMEEFLSSNPGLRSRFNKYLYFEDYSPRELIEILKLQAKKAGLVLSEDAEKFSKEFFEKRCENRPENYANARDVRNYFEKALMNQANRLARLDSIDDNQLSTLEKSDFETILL